MRKISSTKAAVFSAIALILALATFAPIIIMAVRAFQSGGSWSLENMKFVLTEVPVLRWLGNSLLVAVYGTVLTLIVHSMSGYALARLRFPGRDVYSLLVTATMFVSLPVILVPLFIVVRSLGLLDTFSGVVLPMAFGGFATILIRQFMIQIPGELEEAARVDGCGHWRIFSRVVLPISKPILISVGLIVFLSNWNLFLWPLTILSDPGTWTAQVGISSFQTQYSGSWEYVMAVALLSSLPTLIIFFVLQSRIVSSVKTSGLK
jgi:multiple sugar transport system permease protein